MPRPNKMKGTPQKVKNPFKTFKRIVSYMGVYKFYLILILILLLIGSLANVAGTYFLKPLINDYIIPFIGQKNPDLSGFIKALLIMGSVYLIGVISTYVYNKLMVKVATGTLYRIRKDMFFHMQKLPVKYFDTHTHGELMSRYTNDTDTLRDMLSQCFAQFISAAITVIGVFVMMIVLSPALTLLVVAMLVIIILILKFMGKKGGYYFGLQQKEIGKVNGHIEEMIEGQKVVKVFCHEEQAKADFDKLNNDLCEAAKSANTIGNIIMPIMGNLSYAHYAITAMVGGILSVTTGLDLGTLASFLQYTRSFSQPITQMSQQFNFLIVALAGAERIFDLIDQTPETDEGYVTLVNADFDENGNIFETEKRTDIWAWKHPHSDGTITYTQLKGDVTFNHVVFGYNEKKTVLNDISLFAKPGQKIAFVGSTGAGKTTITNLINRFYDIPDGKIRYDGININKIKKDDLRRSLGMVLQDTHLFTGTVMENIRYGRLDATDEEVIEAAKLANADTFIKHLPHGFNTLITSDGTNLSQGQRQLLAIARAAVADPPVLILDEATSSIDTRTEALIQKGMDKLMEGRTVFVIAHRLSTIRNSDAIMVLENGQIIERGNHDELLEQKGRYYQLYTGMFELS
ncbi:MAG: ABC transporter ATP-binding protein [Inconstantimicrobium porci]|uniref:ABC transporter ATP-binding protein n=3 Tax=Inconstantimicrobium porci TaxID=2652291 RepID=A0A7X2N1B9_9CLOT|nr:ABC transporter ATP-binding protein [Inconstantimicrobium porci]MDY5910790.1 ABC transporter ATP-binding protein [Inconstantimicrobium porci]MSR92450.1 ABC transporter ATP-binding protein [Inconstantimicrobium porci]